MYADINDFKEKNRFQMLFWGSLCGVSLWGKKLVDPSEPYWIFAGGCFATFSDLEDLPLLRENTQQLH